MTTYKIVAELASTDSARRLAGRMAELLEPPPTGLTLFECPAGWRIEAYYDDQPNLSDVEAAVTGFLPADQVSLAVEDVPDLNWVEISQAGLPPVHAGRFTIHGSHDRNRVPVGPNSILIDAGEAFGTSHHATTYSCILALDAATRRRTFRNVLDLGCGTGVLAIAAARALPKAKILATDIDPDSVRVARSNGAANRTATRVTFALADGVPRLNRHFDLLIANILAGPLIALAPAISRALAPGGTLILSGILSAQAAAVRARYCSLGFSLERHQRMEGWATLTLKQRR